MRDEGFWDSLLFWLGQDLSWHGDRLVLIALGVAALAILVLWHVIARLRVRQRALGTELARLRMQLLGIEKLQYEADRKATRAEVRLGQVERAQLRAAASFGKADPRVAMALARAGADERALVDCGLSHAESHLVRSLHAARDGHHRENEACVISSANG